MIVETSNKLKTFTKALSKFMLTSTERFTLAIFQRILVEVNEGLILSNDSCHKEAIDQAIAASGCETTVKRLVDLVLKGETHWTAADKAEKTNMLSNLKQQHAKR